MKRSFEDMQLVAPVPERPNISPRCIWTEKEDAMLKELALKYKGKKWRQVAEEVSACVGHSKKRKTPKQCRERWHSHLCPFINTSSWSEEEEQKLFDSHKVVGNKWSVIAENLPGRTDNAIKNYFFCKLRKLARNLKNNVLSVGTSINRTVADQTAYLLNQIYRNYIAPDRAISLSKSSTQTHKGQGDKYIVDIFEQDGVSASHFDKYIKRFLALLPCDLLERVTQTYPYFLSVPATDTEDSFSRTQRSAVKLLAPASPACVPLREQIILPNFLAADLTLPMPALVFAPTHRAAVGDNDLRPSFNFTMYSKAVQTKLELIEAKLDLGMVQSH